MKLCAPVQLTMAEVLSDGGRPIRHVYFPVEGFISLVTLLDGKPVLEVGMVGREGMLGAQMALGVMSEPLHAVVQGPGRLGASESLRSGVSSTTAPTCSRSLASTYM